jgi:hypothetical protein
LIMGNISLPRQPQQTVGSNQPAPINNQVRRPAPVNNQTIPPATPPVVGPQPAPGSAPFQVSVSPNTLEQSVLKEARADFTFLASESDREVLDFEQRVTLIKVNHQSDAGDRADAVGDFFTELVEAGEIKQAQQLLHAFPDLPALQKSLHGALINDLMGRAISTAC